MTIGERIKQARKAKGLTQKQLGEVSGTSEITVRQYEIGKRQPRLAQLQAIAAALGTTMSELVEPGYWATISKEEAQESWSIPVEAHFTESLGAKVRATTRARIEAAVDQMTPAGQNKVADYAEDILPRYRAETTPQSPPAPQEGKDTTPPPDAPETAPEGE